MTLNVYGILYTNQRTKKKSNHYQLQIKDKMHTDAEHSLIIGEHFNKYFLEASRNVVNLENKKQIQN